MAIDLKRIYELLGLVTAFVAVATIAAWDVAFIRHGYWWLVPMSLVPLIWLGWWIDRWFKQGGA